MTRESDPGPSDVKRKDAESSEGSGADATRGAEPSEARAGSDEDAVDAKGSEEGSKALADDQPNAEASSDAVSDESSADEATAKAETATRERKPRRRKPAQPSSATPAATSSTPTSRLLLVAIAVLGIGAGWIAREARARSDARQLTADNAAGEGPCEAWQKEVCQGTGDNSAACTQAKGATELMPAAACGTALTDIDETLTKVKAARAECDTLVGKLCQELGEDSETCSMVRERTATFPPEQCSQMMENFDSVLGQLKMIEQRGGMHGQGPQGAPPRAARPPAAAHPASAPPSAPGAVPKQTQAALKPAVAKPAAQPASAAPAKPAPAQPKPAAPSGAAPPTP